MKAESPEPELYEKAGTTGKPSPRAQGSRGARHRGQPCPREDRAHGTPSLRRDKDGGEIGPARKLPLGLSRAGRQASDETGTAKRFGAGESGSRGGPKETRPKGNQAARRLARAATRTQMHRVYVTQAYDTRPTGRRPYAVSDPRGTGPTGTPGLQGHRAYRDIGPTGTSGLQGHRAYRDTGPTGTPDLQGHRTYRDTGPTGTPGPQGHRAYMDTGPTGTPRPRGERPTGTPDLWGYRAHGESGPTGTPDLRGHRADRDTRPRVAPDPRDPGLRRK